MQCEHFLSLPRLINLYFLSNFLSLIGTLSIFILDSDTILQDVSSIWLSAA